MIASYALYVVNFKKYTHTVSINSNHNLSTVDLIYNATIFELVIADE